MSDLPALFDRLARDAAVIKEKVIRSFIPDNVAESDAIGWAHRHIRTVRRYDEHSSETLVVDNVPVGRFVIELGDKIVYRWEPETLKP